MVAGLPNVTIFSIVKMLYAWLTLADAGVARIEIKPTVPVKFIKL